MPDFAFITVSKGRLHHIKETLPLMAAQRPAELIVVDYGCPDGTGDWVEQHVPAARVVRVTDDEGFSLARARNRGLARASAEWLVFVDADIKVQPGWPQWMEQHVRPGHFYRAAKVNGWPDAETYGTFICARADIERAGRFDEAYRGWGGEDDDMYDTLVRHGVQQEEYPARFVDPIRHGDEERGGWLGLKDKGEKILVNQCYRSAKAQFARANGPSATLPLKERLRIMDVTVRSVRAWSEGGEAEPLIIRYRLGRGRRQVPRRFTMETELQLVIRIGRGERTG